MKMSFKQNICHIFSIFLIISYFDVASVLLEEQDKCGEVNLDGITTQRVKSSEFPWHVGIYRLKDAKHEYLCGGSIITPLIILTAAHCFTNKYLAERYPVQEYYVAAGKYYGDYNAAEDKWAQKNQVKEYHIPPQYKGYETNFAGDLAVVVLLKPFEMTNAVRPVCVDWNFGKFEPLQPNNIGKAVGWNFQDVSVELKQFNSRYIDREACLYVFESKWLTPDTFCTVYTNDSIKCRGFAGGGMFFKWNENNKQKFYIQGVLVGSANNDGFCTNFLSTKISTYIDFIRNIVFVNTDILTRRGQSHSCPVIEIENGQYSVMGKGYVSGTPIPNYSFVKLSCNANYMLFPPISVIACNNGSWIIPIPQCKLACPPRNSSSLNVNCTVEDIPVDCTQPMMEGTVVTSSCKQFYTHSDSDIPISTCIRGSWSNPLVTCKPECGNVVPDGELFIVNGINVKRGKFPWHIALYRLRKGKHEYQCGGSIINPLIIITAAHCFTDYTGKKYPAEEYYVGAGKYYSDYNSPEDKFAQKTQVKEYHIPKEYRGYATLFVGDLAVVIIKTAFQLSNVVQPVCMNWDKFERQHHNHRGSVVGWGYVDPNIPNVNAELKQLNPLYIDRDQCLDEVPLEFDRWVTLDKFCAGFTNGSSVCKGDSGGGLVFKWNNREKFFISGVVSVGPVQKGICDNSQYGVYTKISYYSKFILDIINTNPIIN